MATWLSVDISLEGLVGSGDVWVRPSSSAVLTVTARRISCPKIWVSASSSWPRSRPSSWVRVKSSPTAMIAVLPWSVTGSLGSDPGLLVGLQLLDHSPPGSHQIRIVVHRKSRSPRSPVAVVANARTERRTCLGSTGLSTPCERGRVLVETACRDAHGGPDRTGSPQVRHPFPRLRPILAAALREGSRPERGETRRGPNIALGSHHRQGSIHRLTWGTPEPAARVV